MVIQNGNRQNICIDSVLLTLYDSSSGPSQQLHPQSSHGDLAVAEGQRNGRGMVCKFSLNSKFGQNGKLGHLCVRVTKGRLCDSRVRDRVIVH